MASLGTSPGSLTLKPVFETNSPKFIGIQLKVAELCIQNFPEQTVLLPSLPAVLSADISRHRASYPVKAALAQSDKGSTKLSHPSACLRVSTRNSFSPTFSRLYKQDLYFLPTATLTHSPSCLMKEDPDLHQTEAIFGTYEP